MKKKQEDLTVFKKLEKMFNFNKNNQTIFVPKELAEQIVSSSSPVYDQPKLKRLPKTKKKQSDNLSNKTVNLFDLTDLSDVDPKLKLNLNVNLEKQHVLDFSSKIFNIFSIAEKYKLPQISIDQITSAYYHIYTSSSPEDVKTRPQIANKLYVMDYMKEKNQNNATITKVKNISGTYTLSNWKF